MSVRRILENVTMTAVHIPILLQPIVDALIEPFRALPEDAPPHWIVDCTLGGGGHTNGLLTALAQDPRTAKHKVLSIKLKIQIEERPPGGPRGRSGWVLNGSFQSG